MAISPLLSLAGTALAPLARDVVDQITDGLSFGKLLGRSGTPATLTDASAAEDPSTGFLTSPEAKQLEAIRLHPLQQLEQYVARLRERFAAAGIDLSKEIPLKVGIQGDIQVDGDHPERMTIEDLLASDAQLTTTFRQLANAFEQEHNATSNFPFANEFRLLIDDSEYDFTL